MSLTDQQKLYNLSNYYLLLMIGDDEVCGIISQDNALQIDLNQLYDCGLYLKKANFDELYSQGLNIIKDEKLI